MSNRTPPPARGSREYANAQIRVIGSDDAPYHAERRLRLPGERRFSNGQILRSLAVLAALGGIAAGIFFGVSALLDRDGADPTAATPASAAAAEDTAGADAAAPEEPAEAAAGTGGPEMPDPAAESAAGDEAADEEAAAPAPAEQAEEAEEADEEPAEEQDAEEAAPEEQPPAAEPATSATAARAEPTVSPDPVRREDLASGPLFAERMTAEPVPSGIPRTLADGSGYDAADPATAFSSIWPAGTTLRLTRLGESALLDAEQQAEVAGTQVLVVVRGGESSNSDLQLSAAAFDLIAFYGVERIIAVEVEVTAAPR